MAVAQPLMLALRVRAESVAERFDWMKEIKYVVGIGAKPFGM